MDTLQNLKPSKSGFLTKQNTQSLATTLQIEATLSFLKARENKSKHTLRQYEKEIQRLFWFMHQNKLNNLDDFNESHTLFLIRTFQERNHLHEIPNSPFTKALMPSSLKRNMGLLNTFFKELQNNGVIKTNPLQSKPWEVSSNSILNESSQELTENLDAAEIKHVLSKELWYLVKSAPERLATMGIYTPGEALRLTTTLNIMYDLLLRVEEFTKHGLHNINKEVIPWRITLRGKGDKVATIPLFPDAQMCVQTLYELANWRKGDLRKISLANTQESFVKKLIDENSRIKAGTVYKYLKKHFANCTALTNCEEEKRILLEATPHWIRHTGISHLVNANKNLRSVQLLARHTDINTTASYAHANATDIFNNLT